MESARTKAQRKYDKENTVSITLKLNKTTDAEVIWWLNQQTSKQGAIRRLIQREVDADKPRLF